jgi:hypothetical protein
MLLLMNTRVFYDMTLFSLVNSCQHFGGVCCLSIWDIGSPLPLEMEARNSFEASVNIYQLIPHHLFEDLRLHIET